MKKRLLALFLALALLLATLPSAAAEAVAGSSTLKFTDATGFTFTVQLTNPVLEIGTDGERPVYKVPAGTQLAQMPELTAANNQYLQYKHATSLGTTWVGSINDTAYTGRKVTYYLHHYWYTSDDTPVGECTVEFVLEEVESPTITATPTNDAFYVNGQTASPSAYKINGENYFKLRDIACLLSGTSKQFNVVYDAASQRAVVTTGQGYTRQPTDLQGRPTANASAAYSSDLLVIDGVPQHLTVYKINGANYFRLRDLADTLGFSVEWVAGQGVFVKTEQAANNNSALISEMIALVNAERAKAGLAPLGTYDSLTRAAEIRAQEITTKFSHERPNGTDCYTALDETGAGAGTFYAGENIAAGNATAAATMEQWMDSPGHRNNILNPNYTHIGVGYVNTPDGYHHYWVQMFVGK